MPIRLTDLAKRLYRRPIAKPQRSTRLDVTALEDRIVPANEINISSANPASENNSMSGFISVQRTGDLSQALTVPFTLTGTAVAGTDYTPSVYQFEFEAGSGGAIINFTGIDDAVADPDKTIILTMPGSVGRFTVLTPSQSIPFWDNDRPPLVKVEASGDTVEGGSAKTFTLTWYSDMQGPASANFLFTTTTAQFALGGAAIGGSVDYTASTTTSVVFGMFQTTATVTITPVDDSTAEYDESVILNIGSGTGYTVGSPGSATIIISDNEPPPPPVVTVANLADTREGAAAGAFRFSRTGSTSQALTVGYAVGGAATPGGDYTALSGSVTFPANSATVDVNVSPVDDAIVEYSESVHVTLHAGAGYTVGTLNAATVIIRDNEQPVVMVEKILDTLEGSDSGWFAFSRMGDESQVLTVNFAVSGTATSGTDYTSIGTSVVFAAGEYIAYKEVEALTDAVFDPDELVTVTIAAGVGYTIDTADTATVSIGDATPVVSVQKIFDAFEAGAVEGIFRFSRTGNLAQALTVTYAVGGAATSGTDYTALTGSVVFAAGIATVDVIVTPIDDAVVDPGEKVVATIQAGVGYLVGAASSASVKIVDDDVPVVRARKIRDAAEGAPAQPGTFQFDRSGDTSNALIINYIVSGTATGTEYTTLTGTLTFPANVSVVDLNVTPTTDTAAEGTQTVILEVIPGTNYEADPDAIDVLYICDDDGPAGQIGGVLWTDTDGDGIRESGEPLVAGQAVNLLDADGAIKFQTVSDGSGVYKFVGLATGTYFIQVYAPLLHVFTSPNQGSDEATDSDLNPTTGQSGAIALTTLAMTNLLVGGGFTLIAAPDPPSAPQITIANAWGTFIGPTEELRVAKWANAFETTPGSPKTPRVAGPNADRHDFIDRDDDRFAVYVYDSARYAHMTGGVPTYPTLSVNLSTHNVAGYEAYNDNATEIKLVRMTEAGWAGWYWSDSQILVSNEIDDNFDGLLAPYIGKDDTAPVAGQVNNKNGYLYPVSDRTHRIALAGVVKVTYVTLANNEIFYDGATVKVKKTVKLHVTILRNKAAASGGQRMAEPETVNSDIKIMQEVYAQAGVRFVLVDYVNGQIAEIAAVSDNQVRNPPLMIDGSQAQIDTEPFVSSIGRDENDRMITTDNEDGLLSKTADGYRTPAINGKNDIEIYYLGDITAIGVINGNLISVPGVAGRAFRVDDLPLADQAYGNSVIVSKKKRVRTLAHEAGHILTNKSDHEGGELDPPMDKRTNLMVAGQYAIYKGEVIDSRRLTNEQVNAIHALIDNKMIQ